MHRIEIRPDSPTNEKIAVTDAVVDGYHLQEWAERFSLMTAGYRDRLDPEDAGNPHMAFNLLTVAIMADAKARVFARKLRDREPGHVHLGGEVRPHTQAFMQVMARVYAARGFIVHLRQGISTTPIWYSSFGIFFDEYQSGDNLTASHSPYFKGGWKALDSDGKQITAEEEDIIAEVRNIVSSRSVIQLAPWTIGDGIRADFDVDLAYSDYQRSVLGSTLVGDVVAARERGFRCLATPLGGSMGATTRRLFDRLGIPAQEDGLVTYFLDAEDSRFHRVGEINGENYGADAGKREIYRNLGVSGKVASGAADLVLIWDPDGDRLNIVTPAPLFFADEAEQLGLEVERVPGSQHCVVYFTPIQLYFVLIAYRIELLKRAGLFGTYGWFIGGSFPMSVAILELARIESVPVIRVPVGFRHIGEICRVLEEKDGQSSEFTSVIGEAIPIGANPRALFLCEESGGASFGGADLLRSKSGGRTMLALREKDGMQLALLVLGAAAELHKSGKSFAERYCDLMREKKIQFRFSTRHDVPLYDESLSGEEYRRARSEGTALRDSLVAFFRGLVDQMGSGHLSSVDASDRIARTGGSVSERLPRLLAAHWIGDGSMFEWEGLRLIIRASGTDALMRYYVDGTEKSLVDRFASLTRNFKVPT